MSRDDHDAHAPSRGRTPLPAFLVDPHPGRLAPDHPFRGAILEAHQAAIARGERFYLDPETGLWVMTAACLWERACCENGCRHCPHVDR